MAHLQVKQVTAAIVVALILVIVECKQAAENLQDISSTTRLDSSTIGDENQRNLFGQDYQAILNQLNVKVAPLRNRNAQLKRNAEAITNATLSCKNKVPVNALTKLGDNYYYFETRKAFSKNYQNAAMDCRSLGMQLTTLDTAAENVLVKTKILDIYKTEAAEATPPTVGFFIGLNDFAAPGTYTWIGDGSSLTYTEATFAAPTAGASVLHIRKIAGAVPATLADIEWVDRVYDVTALTADDLGRYICELPKACQTVLAL